MRVYVVRRGMDCVDCSPVNTVVFSKESDARKFVLKDLIRARSTFMDENPNGAWRHEFTKHTVTGWPWWHTYTVFEVGHGDELYDESWVIEEWEVQ